jgi:hypothetical protein
MKTVPVIDANAVYSLGSLTETLSLRPGTLPRELRMKRLRYSKRAGRIWITGRWVLEWLEGGEIRKGAETNSCERGEVDNGRVKGWATEFENAPRPGEG